MNSCHTFSVCQDSGYEDHYAQANIHLVYVRFPNKGIVVKCLNRHSCMLSFQEKNKNVRGMLQTREGVFSHF